MPSDHPALLVTDVLSVALRVSESRYRRLFETAQDGILLLNADTAQIEDVNPYLIDMLGYSHAEFLGKKLWEVGPFADRAESKEMFAELQENGYVRYEDLPLKTRAGAIIPVEFVSNTYDCQGIKVIQCNIRNITERKVAEAKLLRHTQLYAALSQCNKAIMHCASEEELFLTICRAAVQFGGMKMAWVGLVDTDTQMVRPVASFGGGIEYLKDLSISVDADNPFGRGPTGTAIRENRMYWCQDYLGDPSTIPWHQRATRAGLAASASLPLHRNSVVIGAFTLFSEKINSFDEAARDLLIEMSTDISFALENFVRESQRERVEDEIKLKNTILKTQLETSLDAILVVGENAKIISYNQRFIDLWRLPTQLVSARMDAPVLQSIVEQVENSEVFVARVQYLVEHSDEKSREEILLKDGRIIDRYSAPVIGADSQYYGRVWYFRDITERKNLETNLRTTAVELTRANAQIEHERTTLAERVKERTAQLQIANHAKDSFLATMSHEIRTPLAGLLGLMELLTHSPLNVKQEGLVSAARASGKSLQRIVNDILDWSKIEAGKLELVPYVGSVSEMLNGVSDIYAQIASEKGLKLQVTIDPALSPIYLCDFLRVSQILNNFTSNAIKFTSQGEVILHATLVSKQTEHEEVCFSVKDSGIGLTQEQQGHLFKDYTQASVETARMYGGTGLGLAICRKLAEMMGGRLSVQSAVGQGSTFSLTIDLPMVKQSAQHELKQNSEHPNKHSNTSENAPLGTTDKPIHILIVDDHPINRMLLRQQLELLGIQVEAAESGVPALSLWQHEHFDLVVTDCHMPEMDGYELTRQIRAQEKQSGNKHIPIIAWTANVLVEEAEHSRSAGMDDVLTKPTELDVLRKMLVKWLNKK